MICIIALLLASSVDDVAAAHVRAEPDAVSGAFGSSSCCGGGGPCLPAWCAPLLALSSLFANSDSVTLPSPLPSSCAIRPSISSVPLVLEDDDGETLSNAACRSDRSR